MSLLDTHPSFAYLMLGALVASLALVQSIFGVGLLIFGTPSLLLAGARFDEALSILLPASLSVSLLQLACDGLPPPGQLGAYFKFTLPTLGIGLLLGLFTNAANFDFMICSLLVFGAILRVSTRYREKLMSFAKRFGRTMLAAIGLVHGMTNMGGSLLEAYVSSREDEKLNIRQSIACGYALLAGSQLIMLFIVGRLQVYPATALVILVAACVFLTIGRRTFSLIHQTLYSIAVSTLMVFAAFALIAKRVLA